MDRVRNHMTSQGRRKVLLAALPFLALLLYVDWRLQLRNLYFAINISELLLLIVLLKEIPLLDLSVDDLVAVFFFMVLNRVVLQLSFLDTDTLFLFLLSLELLVLVRGIHPGKSGYGVAIGYGVLCCQGVCFVFEKWRRFILAPYYEREGKYSFAVKALYLLVCLFVFSILVLLAVRCLNAFLKKWLEKLQEYSMTYGEIDRSIILVLVLTLGTLSMREIIWGLSPFLPLEGPLLRGSYDPPMLWLALCIIVIVTQIIYIRLLIKSISVKEEMRLQERDMLQLSEYSHGLEENMQAMREIRHDMKNMFLTMGGFVDRSNDGEMKAFYEENIVPFARRELQKNDLYGKLAGIRSEGLKSFLYFKILQGMEQDVDMELQVQVMEDHGIFCMGQTDLIRILGILIDNGVEEAVLCKGKVTIAVREKEQEYLFLVRNTVRPRTREKGVVAGTTEKGCGRGNGLLIVEKLLGKYRNVLLNSFFQGEEFVQCLRIQV